MPRLAASQAGSLAVSVVTRAELMFGLAKRGNPRALSRLVHGFLDRIAVLPWDAAAADRFAQLRAQLERDGTPIGILDTMIAAHALALGAVLVKPQALSKGESAQARELARVGKKAGGGW